MTGGALWRAATTEIPVVLSVVFGGIVLGGVGYAQTSAQASPQTSAQTHLPAQVAAAQKPQPVFTIDDSRVVESSGLAAGTVHPETYYTINDSGGESEVYAVNGETGVVEATLELGEIEPYDWEAIASGPEERIWVGDIGDNNRVREEITLYRFIEPDTLIDNSLQWSPFDFRFTNGPRDAEALLIHPETGQVYVVSKTAGGGAIYAGPEAASTDYANELYKVADAPSLVTDGAFLPDGSAVVLRNYAKAYVMSWPDAEITKTIDLPSVKQGESLAVSADGKRILVGSEGENSPVYSISLTDGRPTNSSTPTPRETESAAPADPDSGRRSAPQGSRLGGTATWVPLVIVGVALLAGALAFPRGRRRSSPPGPRSSAGRSPTNRPPEPPDPAPAAPRDTGAYGPGPYRRRRTPRLPGESHYPPPDPRYPGGSYPESGSGSDGGYSSGRPYWRER